MINNKSAGIKLAGSLTLPKDMPAKAAAILITGSGPQDRNETIFNHQPFLVIADALTKAGYAVLRMDDRGTAKSEGDFSSATSADFMTDISAAVDYLISRNDIPTNKIGLIGHSEGGMIAPMLAAKREDIAFVIMMAGPGIPNYELFAEQQYLIGLSQGASKVAQDKKLKNDKVLFKKIADLGSSKTFGDDIKQLMETSLKLAGVSNEVLLNQNVELSTKAYSTPWFRYFLSYSPRKYLTQVDVPILAMNGSLDLQVASKSNLEGIRMALDSSSHKDHNIVELEDLNHLFQLAKTGAISEYANIEQTISPKALTIMIQWLNKRF